jgi:methionine biosynthesis protein MetW
MRDDLQLISDWIPHNATLLDLGCGDGTLLAHLKTHKQTAGYGLEINQDNLAACFEKGVNVLEQDLDGGLGNFQDHRFDYVVMTQALQAVLRPDQILNEMVRVGREAIITFPNFGHWRSRWYLGHRGKMPVSKFLPYTWYDTPNIHFCTVKDFEALCQEKNIRILNSSVIGADNSQSPLANRFPNLLGVTAVYHISK